MRPYVLLYVTDPGRSQPWYGALGFRLRREHRHGSWAELEWAGGGEGSEFLLFLHASPARRDGGFALPGFEVRESLDTVAARLAPLETRLEGA